MPKKYNLFLKGTVGYWDFNADMVNYVLDKHKDEEVHVLINSLGGDVSTALSISSLFRIHGNVHCHYVAMNASAATIASMGAKHVSIDASALFLVHKCMCAVFEWDYMNADELQAHIEELQKKQKDNETIDACIAGMYACRCKKSKDELLDLMKEGAWLTAQQALEWGFVDEITNNPDDDKPELTDSVASVIADAGIPMPPLDAKRGSLLERVLQFLIPSSAKSAAAAHNSAAPAPTVTPMPTTFTALAAIIGGTVAVTDGKVSLTQEQADKLENAVAGHNATVADLNTQIGTQAKAISDKDAKIAELNAKINDLVKTPAESTNTPHENSREEKPLNGIDTDKAVAALLDILP